MLESCVCCYCPLEPLAVIAANSGAGICTAALGAATRIAVTIAVRSAAFGSVALGAATGVDAIAGRTQSICDRSCDLRVMPDKSPVEVDESEENLHIMDRFGLSPVLNGGQWIFLHFFAFSRYDIAKEAYPGHREFRLLGLTVESELAQGIQD